MNKRDLYKLQIKQKNFHSIPLNVTILNNMIKFRIFSIVIMETSMVGIVQKLPGIELKFSEGKFKIYLLLKPKFK